LFWRLVTAVFALAAAWVALASAAGSTIVPDVDAVAEAGLTVIGTVPRSEVLGRVRLAPIEVIGSEAEIVLRPQIDRMVPLDQRCLRSIYL